MKRFTTIAGLAGGLLAGFSSHAAPLAVGTVSDDVGYSEATGFNGSNYGSLIQQHISDHSETVLAIAFATPW